MAAAAYMQKRGRPNISTVAVVAAAVLAGALGAAAREGAVTDCAWGMLFGFQNKPEGEQTRYSDYRPESLTRVFERPIGGLDFGVVYFSTIYIMPRSGRFTIRGLAIPKARAMDISIYDVYGQTLSNINSYNIDRDGPNGSYTIEVTDDMSRSSERNVLAPGSATYMGRQYGFITVRFYVPRGNNRAGGRAGRPDDTLPTLEFSPGVATRDCRVTIPGFHIHPLPATGMLQGLIKFSSTGGGPQFERHQMNMVLPLESFGLTKDLVPVPGPSDDYMLAVLDTRESLRQDWLSSTSASNAALQSCRTKEVVALIQGRMPHYTQVPYWSITAVNVDRTGAILPTIATALPFYSDEERDTFYASPTDLVKNIAMQPDGTFLVVVGDRIREAFAAASDEAQDMNNGTSLWGATFIDTTGADRPALLFRQSFVKNGAAGFNQDVGAYERARQNGSEINLHEFMGDYYPKTRLCRNADFIERGVRCATCVI